VALGSAAGVMLLTFSIEGEMSKLSKFETRFYELLLLLKLEDAHVAQLSHYRGREQLQKTAPTITPITVKNR
jgi:hypothetical protein